VESKSSAVVVECLLCPTHYSASRRLTDTFKMTAAGGGRGTVAVTGDRARAQGAGAEASLQGQRRFSG
jgi:hypothetical protein